VAVFLLGRAIVVWSVHGLVWSNMHEQQSPWGLCRV